MTINNKTLTTVEGLVTNPATTEGNFRIGMGDVLTQVNTTQENATSGNTCSVIFDYPGTHTWTAPAACTVMIQAIGAGGSGGAVGQDDTSNVRAAASGGSGGGYSRVNAVSLTSGATLTINVGAGGVGVTQSNTGNNTTVLGGTGGNTTVTGPNSLSLTANGGQGGPGHLVTSNYLTYNNTSSGGTASGGDVNNQGISGTVFTNVFLASAGGLALGSSGSFTSGFDDSHSATQADITVHNGGALSITTQSAADASNISNANRTVARHGVALNSDVRGFAVSAYAIASGSSAGATATGVPGVYGTGGAPAVVIPLDNDTGGRSATGGDGGDGVVIITLLNL